MHDIPLTDTLIKLFYQLEDGKSKLIAIAIFTAYAYVLDYRQIYSVRLSACLGSIPELEAREAKTRSKGTLATRVSRSGMKLTH